jgi:hypothetical protein
MELNNIDISKLPADVRKKFKQLQVLHAERKIQNKAKSDFLSFVKCMWPDFVEGSHHRHIAEKFNKLATGEITRLIVNMPPRHTKSEFASFLLPSWMVGRNPKLKIIQATHTGELAVRFGRKAKHLIDSEDYRKIFDTTLQEDSKAAGRWETAQGGEYFAAGVGGAITGRGADLLIIDDPTLGTRCIVPNSIRVCLRMVYIRTTTKTSTRRQDRLGYDTLVNKRFNSKTYSEPKRTEV